MSIIAKIRYRHRRGCKLLAKTRLPELAKTVPHCECKKTPRVEIRHIESGAVFRRTVGGSLKDLLAAADPWLVKYGVNRFWFENWLREKLKINEAEAQSGRLPIAYTADAFMSTHQQENGHWTLTLHGRYRHMDYFGAVPLPGRYDTEEEATEAGQVILAREAVLEAAEAKRGQPES